MTLIVISLFSPLHPEENKISEFCFFLQQLRTKIRTLPDKRVSNERNLSNEQKRYDRILELAPAKEMVSIFSFLFGTEES